MILFHWRDAETSQKVWGNGNIFSQCWFTIARPPHMTQWCPMPRPIGPAQVQGEASVQRSSPHESENAPLKILLGNLAAVLSKRVRVSHSRSFDAEFNFNLGSNEPRNTDLFFRMGVNNVCQWKLFHWRDAKTSQKVAGNGNIASQCWFIVAPSYHATQRCPMPRLPLADRPSPSSRGSFGATQLPLWVREWPSKIILGKPAPVLGKKGKKYAKTHKNIRNSWTWVANILALIV